MSAPGKSAVEEIKEKLSIEEVVGSYVKLTPAGSNLKAKCPFHSERTPSFIVSPLRGTYHCFGCSVGGDMFSFIEAIEGTDFKGALKILADRAGVELHQESYTPSASKDALTRLYDCLETAAQFYEQVLTPSSKSYTYLRERGLSPETITQFRIGWAADEWEGLRTHLHAHGFTEKEMEDAGLVKQGEKGKGVYDRFRSRIMFPIFDVSGRVVAFTGRIFDKEIEGGKYVNSPETSLYKKGKMLYGFDRAKQSIRKNNFAILVEGQMDLIAVHQAGYTNTVALSGTALTEEHVKLLSRFSKNLVIALDNDAAGVTAAGRSARAALTAGFDVKVAAVTGGKDPADMLQSGDTDEWKHMIREATHVVDFLLAHLAEHAKDTRALRIGAVKEVLPFVSIIPSPVERAHWTRHIAEALGVPEEVIGEELARIPREESPGYTTVTPVSSMRAADVSSTHDGAAERLVAFFLWVTQLPNTGVDAASLEKKIRDTVGDVTFEAVRTQCAERPELFFVLEEQYRDTPYADIEDALVFRARRESLQHAYDQTVDTLRRAELTNDATKIQKALTASDVARKALAEHELQGLGQ